MPGKTEKTSISLDLDLIGPAKYRSLEMFGIENLSRYINKLIRQDLGLSPVPSSSATRSAARAPGRGGSDRQKETKDQSQTGRKGRRRN